MPIIRSTAILISSRWETHLRICLSHLQSASSCSACLWERGNQSPGLIQAFHISLQEIWTSRFVLYTFASQTTSRRVDAKALHTRLFHIEKLYLLGWSNQECTFCVMISANDKRAQSWKLFAFQHLENLVETVPLRWMSRTFYVFERL